MNQTPTLSFMQATVFILHKLFTFHRAVGSVTLQTKRGSLLRLSTMNAMNGWSTVNSTGGGGGGYGIEATLAINAVRYRN